ncbi:MAG: hypothetical protein WC333_00145 [Dehalococcoidia bacterium]|jgi:heme/copper-type cytochrome/quinol oxidase subunit 2
MAYNKTNGKVNEVFALLIFMVVIMAVTYLFLAFCNWNFRFSDWNGFSRFLFGVEGVAFIIKLLIDIFD